MVTKTIQLRSKVCKMVTNTIQESVWEEGKPYRGKTLRCVDFGHIKVAVSHEMAVLLAICSPCIKSEIHVALRGVA